MLSQQLHNLIRLLNQLPRALCAKTPKIDENSGLDGDFCMVSTLQSINALVSRRRFDAERSPVLDAQRD